MAFDHVGMRKWFREGLCWLAIPLLLRAFLVMEEEGVGVEGGGEKLFAMGKVEW